MPHNEIFLEEETQIWKIGLVVYFFLIVALMLDSMNFSFLWSPPHFTFVPLLLFVGAIKFPRVMFYSVGFALGLLTDILSYAPIGLMGGLYFLTLFLCRWQRRFIMAQSFYVIWIFFVLYWSLFLLLDWSANSLYARALFEIRPAIDDCLYGAFFFPLVWLFFEKINTFFSESERGL